MSTVAENKAPLTSLQLELLKSLKYVVSEEQVAEIKSLLRYYFAKQLDAAIDKSETHKNYIEAIYENWLASKSDTDNNISVAHRHKLPVKLYWQKISI